MTLIDREHKRGLGYERKISEQYLARLADAYSRYFYSYEEAPLLIVNSERLNFVDNPEHLQLLIGRVGIAWRGNGRRNFHQLGENYPQAQPEPAYEFDQRIAW
jgi:deoxyguanosine kinase